MMWQWEFSGDLLAPNHSLEGGGGGGGDDYSRRNPQRGALPSLACPAEQGRYDIHGLES